MTLTPDRRRDKQYKSDEAASPAVSAGESGAEEVGNAPTYRDLLRGVGFDLEGHPLADRFDEIASPPPDDFEFADTEHPVVPAEAPAESADDRAVESASTKSAESAESAEDDRQLTQADSAQPDSAQPDSAQVDSARVEPAQIDSAKTGRWGGRSLWDASVDDPEAKAELQQCAAELDAEKEAWMRKKAEEAAAERDAVESSPEYSDDDDWAELRSEQLVAEPSPAEHAPTRGNGKRSAADTGGAANLGGIASDSEHPLLDDHAWTDLTRIAPEIADSIHGLRHLVGDLESFNRPMGPDDAITVVDGLETVNRLVESLSVVSLSVFERVGTPRDYGAKSTKALIQNRLNLSEREAGRRSHLAEKLGNQVSFSGESLGPVFPAVSEALQNGYLSSTQASAIIGCLKDLPSRVGQDERREAEQILVEKAPTVRVKDIQALFNEILAWLDPDGELPDEAPDRDEFSVSLRQRKDGSWTLKGVLDAVTGGIMSGHLTSRIKADDREDDDREDDDREVDDKDAANDVVDGSGADVAVDGDQAGDEEVVEVFSEVLRGDRWDAVDPALNFSPDHEIDAALGGPQDERTVDDGDVDRGCGVREDGSIVAMAGRQPSVKTKIYERFATMIGRIEMNRVMAGSPFALVVTAKAEDLAKRSGRAVTDAEAPFPMETAAKEGLNGSVFFHLMGDKAKSMQLATERRFATPKQLTILSSRDQGCTFPGCDTPPGWCDAHHIVPWADKGETDINNLTLACGSHHHLIDKSDWHTVMLKDGRPAWVPPASIDPARRPILHARFIAKEITDTLFD